MTLPRWQFDDPDYWRLLATFGAAAAAAGAIQPDRPGAGAAYPAPIGWADRGHDRLLRQAAVQAVRTGHERIDRAMLDRVTSTTPAPIEALAASEQL